MITMRRRTRPGEEIVLLVPTLSGTVFSYLDIVRSLPPEAEAIGLPNRHVALDVDGTGKAYAAEIVEAFGWDAKLKIVGWSYAGVVAYALAAHLVLSGLRPVCTFMIDAPLPIAEDREIAFNEIERKFVEMITEQPAAPLYPSFSSMLSEIRDAGFKLKPDALERMFLDYIRNYSKWTKYDPRATSHATVLFEAQIRRWSEPRFRRWERYAHNMKVVPMPGTHYNLVKQPFAAEIGRAVATGRDFAAEPFMAM